MFLLLETSEVICLLQLFFEDNIDDAKYCGRLYGLGSGSTQNQNGISSSSQEETNNKHWLTMRPSSGRLTCFIPSGRCFSSPLTPRRKHEIHFCIELHQLQKGHWLPHSPLETISFCHSWFYCVLPPFKFPIVPPLSLSSTHLTGPVFENLLSVCYSIAVTTILLKAWDQLVYCTANDKCSI